jgi:hypothetical protein
MKRVLMAGLGSLVAASLSAAGFDAKADVKAAAQKLAGGSYSWTSTPKSEGGGGQGGRRFQAGPTEGKTEKDGFTWLSTKIGESAIEAAMKGGKAAVKTGEGWKAAGELGGEGANRRDPAAGFARRLAQFKAPAADAEGLVDKVRDLKDEGEGVYSGELTEEGAKELLTFGGRPGGQAPQVADPKGSAKFWVKEGQLVKYEYNVQGKVTFGQREIAVNRTTTVEIKDAGTTKVEIPEDAQKKLE